MPNMDFKSVLDYIATVGYDVDFLRGGTIDLLAANPVAEGEGPEQFDPRSAPLGALAATGPWAARLLQGGGTFIDELAGSKTWGGSLDLPGSARRVGEMVSGWMEDEISREADLITSVSDSFPVGATAAEQLYSLRDAIQFSEQWFPGLPSSRPALTLLLAFCIGVDEFLCPTETLDSTVFLGRRLGDLWDECLAECEGREDAARWLELARDALRSSVFLQNREKLVYLGLIVQDKHVFTDWDTTSYYMLRAEAAMTSFVALCLCAYSGLAFREDLAGAVGLYSYANAFILDFCKRATRLGGGNYTEVALEASGELQGRSHLIGALLAYGEEVLPSLFLCVLRPFVLETSSAVDVLDRYRERSWGLRLPLGQATLWMMKAVMEGAGGTLGDMKPPSQTELPQYTQLAAEVIDAMGVWDAYESYASQPSVEGLYRLPRPVRLALQLNGVGQYQSSGKGRSLRSVSWMDCLCKTHLPPLPKAPKLNRGLPISSTKRLPPIRLMEATGLDPLIVRSPARPGGYASGQREFTGRPVGSGSALK